MDNVYFDLTKEGIVLLKNDNNTLPLLSTDNVSVFGRCQYDLFYVGYGSGNVNDETRINIIDGLNNYNINYNHDLALIYQNYSKKNKVHDGVWGLWPTSHPELVLSNDIVSKSKEISNKAVYIIGRCFGEDMDEPLTKGGYYLTDTEINNLKLIEEYYDDYIILINSGNIIDLSFLKDFHPKSILYVWFPGSLAGNAIGAILKGTDSPSGKMPVTVATSYNDYITSKNFGNKEKTHYYEDIFVGYRYFLTFAKDKILYPFGYGCSYTNFSIKVKDAKYINNKILISVICKNIGIRCGKDVIQIYVSSPVNKLSKASKVLVAFKKTKLLKPLDEEILEFSIDEYLYSSYDDTGITGYKSSYVLENGSYQVLLGEDSLNTIEVLKFSIDKTKVIKKCNEICKLNEKLNVLSNSQYEKLNDNDYDLRKRILDNLPKEIPYTGDLGIKLIDVYNNKNTLDEFIGQLSNKDLTDLCRGEGFLNSKLGVKGNAGVFGGYTKRLQYFGVPVCVCCDGPAGLRIEGKSTNLPSETLIASTFNEELVYECFKKLGKEMVEVGCDAFLAPGMNIHRHPLNGRNFEYYSEDPLLTGIMGSSTVKGVQENLISACPKHFACNNQEYGRRINNSIVSERALREIYTKGFEFVIKNSKPYNIMTSYNRINGVWSHYNYDLVTTLLRKEWGYTGNVMTDWFMKLQRSKEFPKIKNNSYRVRSGVDVLMPGGKTYLEIKYRYDWAQLKSLGEEDGITIGEYQECSKHVLKFLMNKFKYTEYNK